MSDNSKTIIDLYLGTIFRRKIKSEVEYNLNYTFCDSIKNLLTSMKSDIERKAKSILDDVDFKQSDLETSISILNPKYIKTKHSLVNIPGLKQINYVTSKISKFTEDNASKTKQSIRTYYSNKMNNDKNKRNKMKEDYKNLNKLGKSNPLNDVNQKIDNHKNIIINAIDKKLEDKKDLMRNIINDPKVKQIIQKAFNKYMKTLLNPSTIRSIILGNLKKSVRTVIRKESIDTNTNKINRAKQRIFENVLTRKQRLKNCQKIGYLRKNQTKTNRPK